MTTLTLAARKPASRAIAISAVVAAMALASQFAIPLPGTPVPLTLPPLVVLLAGLLLGPVDAAIAMITYLCLGAAGLPVFTPIGAPGIARLLGPTGGYLLAYPVAAAVAGRFGANEAAYARRAIASIWGIAVIYMGGVAQLTVLSGSVQKALLLGVLPFIAADIVKALVAAALGGGKRANI